MTKVDGQYELREGHTGNFFEGPSHEASWKKPPSRLGAQAQQHLQARGGVSGSDESLEKFNDGSVGGFLDEDLDKDGYLDRVML